MAANLSISGIAGSGGVTAFTLVKMGSGLVDQYTTDTDGDCIGVVQNTAASGEPCTVVLSGKTLARAGAAITAGSMDLYANSSSEVINAHAVAAVRYLVGAYVPPSTDGGAAQDAADGDLVEILLYQCKTSTKTTT